MDQGEFTGIFCARPQNFAWFLGAGASRSAGLPTATDIIWDLKRKYYCREENQDISRQDIQNDAVRARIQAFMESRDFPALWADEEYPTYFRKIFGEDKERQRKYLKAILSEDRVTLSIGNRVLGALIASRSSRVVFTTNFDSVVEKAVAEVSGQSLSAYHLEGSHVAKQALDNEEYPIYCKLHGDFRYDSLKNLPDDLATQNAALSQCLINAATRFGFVVTGYSGRDASIMKLFHAVLECVNPFPHGLFWTGMKGSAIPPAVERLLDQASAKGIEAHYVPIETFDSLLLRLWRNIDSKSPDLDAQVRKARAASVHIPLAPTGRRKPLLRLNALPITSLPQQCLELSFRGPKDWDDLRQARQDSMGQLILTKSDIVMCWGTRKRIQDVFGQELLSIQPCDLPTDLLHNLHLISFIQEALCKAIVRDKPLLYRSAPSGAFLIADPHANAQSDFAPLCGVVDKVSGLIPGLFAPATENHPECEQVTWSEAARVSIDSKDGKLWLLLDPDIWIWPLRARKSATELLDERRGDRYNNKYNTLLDAWVRLILGTDKQNTQVILSAFGEGSDSENPSFEVGSRTAFSRRLS